jgi:hypothetical protein
VTHARGCLQVASSDTNHESPGLVLVRSRRLSPRKTEPSPASSISMEISIPGTDSWMCKRSESMAHPPCLNTTDTRQRPTRGCGSGSCPGPVSHARAPLLAWSNRESRSKHGVLTAHRQPRLLRLRQLARSILERRVYVYI